MNTENFNLTHDDVDRILDVVNKIDDVDLQITIGDFSLRVRKGNVGAFADLPAPAPVPGAPDGNAEVRAAQVAASQVDLMAADSNAVITAVAPGGTDTAASVGSTTESDTTTIVAPMIGRFYSKPSPNDPPFVDVGAVVSDTDTVCILEVMKLFNSVPAGVSGQIVEVLAQDGEMVQEGDALFRVRVE